MASNTLKQIFAWNLTANNMISISLMYDSEAKFNKYFIFFNMIPGVSSENGRSFDFSGAINLKLVPSKLAELAHVLPILSRGQGKMIGTYSIMTDSSKSQSGSGGKKSLFFNYNVPSEKYPNPSIMVSAKSESKNISVSLPIPTALMFADVCQKIFDHCMKLEIENYVPYSKVGDSDQNRGKSFNNNSRTNGFNNNSNQPADIPNFDDEDVPF